MGRHRAAHRSPRAVGRPGASLLAALSLAGLLGGPVAVEGPAASRASSPAAPGPPLTWRSSAGEVGDLSPNRLLIPSLGVEAPIDTAHAVAGSLALPPDASRVARYDASPPLAARAGTTIVAGHVTNRGQAGALFLLATVRPGARVQTSDAAGRRRTWRVVLVSAPRKADLPPDIFTAAGPRRLAIITCGGTPTVGPDGARHYPRNIVVIATPEPGMSVTLGPVAPAPGTSERTSWRGAGRR